MSVDRAQIEHLRSFVATPRCMSYETIRSLDDILDNLEAASSEVAALRRQVEERETTIGAILESSEALMEYVDRPPERNCSCHISPPCSDCVENSHLRGAFERLDDARKMYNALLSGEAGKGVG